VPKVVRCPPHRQRRGEHPAICWELRVSGATRLMHEAVTMRPVRTISRKDRSERCSASESSETIRRTSALGRMMRWSHLHGDMQGAHGADQRRVLQIGSKTTD
jgi:hypothetical protein